jgi:Fe2+ or Zn2+ uptake regulation protein
MSLTQAWLDRLQTSGYHLTIPLRALVGILAESERALSPTELHDLGRQACPGLGLVTVYRALEKLEELGLVTRVHQAGGCHCYVRAAAGHQHLLLCTACGRAEYFSGDDLGGLIASLADRSGFRIQEHWLQLYGLCADCEQQAAAETGQ